MDSDYMQRLVLDWLDNISPVPDNESSKPPSKRLRLDDFEHAYNKYPGQILNRDQTPPASGSGSIAFLPRLPDIRPACPINQLDGTQDPWEEGDEGQEHSQVPSSLGRQIQLISRPARRKASAIDNSSPASWLPSSTASSKVSKLTRRSSPTKQLRNAELEETGFLRADFRYDTKPELLDELTMKLEKTDRGFGILPNSLRDNLADERSIAACNFGDRPESQEAQLPDIHTVQKIYNLARRCFKNNHLESSWNNDVHSRILDWVLRDSPRGDDLVDYRCCLTADIIPEYQPRKSLTKKVDYCICIQPGEDSPQYEAIQSLSRYRPELSINHTDWADLTKYPIAISIETKGRSLEYDAALLQVATWHSAQWRSLFWDIDGDVLAHSKEIEFLPGIIVMQHQWWFVATVLNQNGKSRTFERLLLGGTDSILGIYKLVISLQKLVEWTRDEYWPKFQAIVLGL
ncbi:hypothetical protein BJX63DRAFT_439009 [Aspergillus granulosus]|uniref:PD-(D/E)XK nuclease-like domain-containing protein n=1 Tax=Aspergillus granulosus TaxID=176169 RepID=A0ABR4HVG7_9EURO